MFLGVGHLGLSSPGTLKLGALGGPCGVESPETGRGVDRARRKAEFKI